MVISRHTADERMYSMMTSSTETFSAQKPVARSFDVFFDLRLNKRLSKQSWGCWFETPSRPLWRNCNDIFSKSVWLSMTPYHLHGSDYFFHDRRWDVAKSCGTSIVYLPVNLFIGGSVRIDYQIPHILHLLDRMPETRAAVSPVYEMFSNITKDISYAVCSNVRSG